MKYMIFKIGVPMAISYVVFIRLFTPVMRWSVGWEDTMNEEY